MKLADIRQQESATLRGEVAAAEHEIWELRFQRGSEKAGDPSKINGLRKKVARMLTILRERELDIRGAGTGTEGSDQ